MPIAPMMAEIVPEVVYDSEPLGSESNRLALFVNPFGAAPANQPNLRKTQRDTNMWLSGSLPAPQRFLMTGIRCIYFEPSGEVVPVTDACYWDTTIEFLVSSKIYWLSPVALAVDPMILTTPAQWNEMGLDRRLQLMKRFGQHSECAAIRPDQIVSPGFPKDVTGKSFDGVKVEGILIEQQQNFGVRIDHQGKWPGRRILCCLDGRMVRPIL